MSDNISITLTGQTAYIARIKGADKALVQTLRSRLTEWAMRLRDQAAAATNPKSGRLGASITASVSSARTSVRVDLSSSGVPYAGITEFGGSVPGHEIYPIKGMALSFAFGARGASGGDYFAHVFWPGAAIPGKHYIFGTLKAHRQEFLDICKQAMQESLPG
jgi:hypothetical protein